MTDRLKLDRYGLTILQKLQQEGRITKVALAEAVNLSSGPCWERLRRLEVADYISGYQANLNLRMLSPVTEVPAEVTPASHQVVEIPRFETVRAWARGVSSRHGGLHGPQVCVPRLGLTNINEG